MFNLFKNLFKKKIINAPEHIQERVLKLYNQYRDEPSGSNVDLIIVQNGYDLFVQLIEYTGPLVDEHEFSRRLISSADLMVRETIDDKLKNTSKWLKKQTTITAGQAENILHNLYYCIHLHTFNREVTQTFDQIDKYCVRVEQSGII